MADDSLQTGTDTIATDHVTTLNGAAVTQSATSPKVQRVKVAFGDDGSARDVSALFPLPTVVPDAVSTGTISATDAVVGTHAGAGVPLSGTPTAGSFVALAIPGGEGVFTLLATGTFGGGTLWFEASVNSTTGTDGSWVTLSTRTIGTATTVTAESTSAAGVFRGNPSGFAYVRARITGATTPSVTVVIRGSDAPGPVAMNAPLPTGTNMLGRVAQATDLARTYFSATFDSTAAPIADTLIATLSVNRNGTVTTGQTSVAATAGKTLRITSINLQLRTTTAALPFGTVFLRVNLAGAAVLASPVAYRLAVSGTAAVTGNTGTSIIDLDPGLLDLSGTAQFALSFSNNVATNVTAITVGGYEFTTPA